MLDSKTGALHVSPPCVLGPATTVDAFRETALAAEAAVVTDNPTNLTLFVNVLEPGTPRNWALFLCFRDSTLEMIVMSDVTDQRDEDLWSDENEQQKKTKHDRWLNETLGARRKFPWGTASSAISRRDNEASIVLDYGRRTR